MIHTLHRWLLLGAGSLALYAQVLAAPVTARQAVQKAEAFFARQTGLKSLAAPCQLLYACPARPTVSQPPLRALPQQPPTSLYYVITRPDNAGYAIVAGDDRVKELLAFADEGSLTEEALRSHPGLKYLLGLYADQIQWALDHLPDSPASSFRAGTSEDLLRIGLRPLLALDNDRQTRLATPISWGQAWPFNLYTPHIKKNGTNYTTVSGCVATGISTALRWHKWPDKPQGRTGYNWYGHWLSVDYDREDGYDWAKMPAAVTGRGNNRDTGVLCTDQEADNVGRLLRDVGYAVRMGYGRAQDGGSGTQVSYAVGPLVNNFKYKSDLRIIYRHNFSDAAWWEQVTDELDNYGPIVYAGFSSGGGHCFNLDGYATRAYRNYVDNYVHVDWGWNRNENGWYLLDVLQPGSEGIGGGDGSGYSSNQQMLRYLFPDRQDVAPRPQKKGYVLRLTSALKTDRQLKSSATDYPLSFTLANEGDTNYTGLLRVFAVRADADPLKSYQELEPKRDDKKYTILQQASKSVTYRLDLSKLEAGDYYLHLAYSIGEQQNRYLRNAQNDLTPALRITLTDRAEPKPDPTPEPSPSPKPQPVSEAGLHIQSLATPTSLEAARDQKISITVANHDAFGYYGDLALCIARSSADAQSTILTTARPILPAKSSKAVTFTADLSAYSAGQYHLYVAYRKSGAGRVYQWKSIEEEAGVITIREQVKPVEKHYSLYLTQAAEQVRTTEGTEKVSFKFTVMNAGEATYGGRLTVFARRIYQGREQAEQTTLVTSSGDPVLTAKTATEVTCYAPIDALTPGDYALYLSYDAKDGSSQTLTDGQSQSPAQVGYLHIEAPPKPQPQPQPEKKTSILHPTKALFYQGGLYKGEAYAKLEASRASNTFRTRIYLQANEPYRGKIRIAITSSLDEANYIASTAQEKMIQIRQGAVGYVDAILSLKGARQGFHKLIVAYQEPTSKKWHTAMGKGIPFEIKGRVNDYINPELDGDEEVSPRDKGKSYEIAFRSVELGGKPAEGSGENLDGDNPQITPVDEAALEQVSLYPTYTEGELHVRLAKGGLVQVFDLQGQVVARRELSAGTTTLQLGHLPAGTYLLRVGDRSLRFVRR